MTGRVSIPRSNDRSRVQAVYGFDHHRDRRRKHRARLVVGHPERVWLRCRQGADTAADMRGHYHRPAKAHTMSYESCARPRRRRKPVHHADVDRGGLSFRDLSYLQLAQMRGFRNNQVPRHFFHLVFHLPVIL